MNRLLHLRIGQELLSRRRRFAKSRCGLLDFLAAYLIATGESTACAAHFTV
jgi:hypothetical protein